MGPLDCQLAVAGTRHSDLSMAELGAVRSGLPMVALGRLRSTPRQYLLRQSIGVGYGGLVRLQQNRREYRTTSSCFFVNVLLSRNFNGLNECLLLVLYG